jgi:hypothetical protein
MNMHELKYKNKVIEYDIVKSNIKNVYIHIKNSRVIVKAPEKMLNSQIDKIVESKKNWIYEKINKFEKKDYKNGDFIKVLGKDYILHIEFLNIDEPIIKLNEGHVFVQLPKNKKRKNNIPIIEELVSKLYMNIAEKEVAMQMALVTRIVGIRPNKYRIKRIKTAWGTCTSNKNITINSELMKYDREVIQYVILHEICHLKYMNHSKDFWNMVEKYMKNYKEVRSRLK